MFFMTVTIHPLYW